MEIQTETAFPQIFFNATLFNLFLRLFVMNGGGKNF